MKLLRYGSAGNEKPGVLDSNSQVRDLSAYVADIGAATMSPDALASLARVDVDSLPLVAQANIQRIGPPVSGVGKVVGIGLNYRDHAKEAGLAIPAEPIIFMKATTSICGPDDDVVQPRGSTKLDWEVELGVVIGTRAQYVDESDALDYVAGYCVVNDVSERAFQIEGTGQWTKGKSADTFCPFGPYLVTADEVADPQNLSVWLEVNGRRLQEGRTDDMIFSVAHLVSYVSCHMTLEPGDLVITGTPSGVGMGLKPQMFLKPGDEMRLGIEGLGEQYQKVIALGA